jgi:phosphate transport system substrate-binding protein
MWRKDVLRLSRGPARVFALSFVLVIPPCALGAEPITVNGTGAVLPVLKLLVDDFAAQSPGQAPSIQYPPTGSAGSIRAVAQGRLDLAVAARAPRAEEAGAKWQVIPWVKTAFVIVANRPGPAKGYTRAELAAIWTGAIMQWPDGRPIRLVLRTPDDSDVTSLRAMSPEMSRAVDTAYTRPGLPKAEHDLQNLEMLAKVPGAMGTGALGLLISSGSRLTPLPVEGIAPTTQNLRDGTYPFQRTFYLVSDGGTRVRPFIAYLNSARALKLLEQNGFLAAKP